MTSWPLLIINSSAFYHPHTHARTHAYKCQISTANARHLPPHINMRLHHSEEADGQLVVKNELALLEKDNTLFCLSAHTPSLLFISHLLTLLPSLFFCSSPSSFSTLLPTCPFSPPCVHVFIQSVLLYTHPNVNSVSWGQWLPSPLFPCSDARGSHRRRCPRNTPLFPLLWARCRRSEEQGTVWCVRRTAKSIMHFRGWQMLWDDVLWFPLPLGTTATEKSGNITQESRGFEEVRGFDNKIMSCW